MAISAALMGHADGKPVDILTLTNANDLVLRVTTYGGIVTELHVPDRDGRLADVVLGFEDIASYVKHSPYFGATVGRVANRIRDARFELEGQSYQVAANNGAHHLHGGLRGWDKVIWQAEQLSRPEGPSVRLTHVSADGEEGYPGNVRATTIYTLTNKNELVVEMLATADQTTLVNMVHHTYWNLGGANHGTITDHELTLQADAYTPGDPVVPTGQETPVHGTAFDFRTAKVVGRDLAAAGGKPVGYDHNFIVNGEPDRLRPVARLKEPASGRVMTLQADQPGVQFYSGNFLDGTVRGKGGIAYAQYAGLCLETQKFPNAVNVPAWRGQVVVKPGQTYKHTMIHRFTAE